jgi:hypothetical protein
MRLLVSIGTSVICGTAVAAVLYRYVMENAAAPAFWGSDPFAALWTGFGGAGGILVLAYALFAFALITCYAWLDLGAARTRLTRADTDGTEAPELLWRAAFADTDFKAIAGQLTPYELGAAPLSLLRLLRTEIWRIYLKRVLCAATVAIALGAAVVALAPLLPGLAALPPQPLSAAAEHWRILAAFVVLVGATATWLAMDGAIGRLAMTMTRLSAAWADAVPLAAEPLAPLAREGTGALALSPPSLEPLAAALDRLVAELAAQAPAAAETSAATVAQAIDALKLVMDDAAAAQRAMIEQLADGLAAQSEELVRRVEAARPAEVDIAALSAAMSELATAVDKLADPVLRRMQLLGATDRRLLSVLRRQENTVGSVTTRWAELVGALQAMSAGLDSFAQVAARHEDADTHLMATSAPPDLTDELQELLDEISATTPVAKKA